MTAYSVLVKHIVEEEVNYDIVTLSEEDRENGLTYVIQEQYPTDGTGMSHLLPFMFLLV